MAIVNEIFQILHDGWVDGDATTRFVVIGAALGAPAILVMLMLLVWKAALG